MSHSTWNEPQGWEQIFIRVGFNVFTHPFEYSKLLIQIGHEPLPAYDSYDIYGRKKSFYPSIFAYIRHIKREKGLAGCYNGVFPSLSSKVIGGLTCQKVAEYLPLEASNEEDKDVSDWDKFTLFVRNTARESVCRAAGIIASHPFHVLACRTMAQFVGGEQLYTGVFSGLWHLWSEEGVSGLLAGLAPRLLCDMGVVWMSGTLIFIVNNLVLEDPSLRIEDKSVKVYSSACIRFIASSFFYEFHVVSSCMAVTGASLAAAQPPNMPVYDSWGQCWQHMRALGGLKRGSSLIWRNYVGPAWRDVDSYKQ